MLKSLKSLVTKRLVIIQQQQKINHAKRSYKTIEYIYIYICIYIYIYIFIIKSFNIKLPLVEQLLLYPFSIILQLLISKY